MAENNGKKYYIAIIIPLLLILAAVIFLLKTIVDRQNSWRPPANETGYIDATAVYRSNKNYNIAQKEIAEYAARVNNELKPSLAHEKDPAKRQSLMHAAQREIDLYAQTLLQDITSDVDSAIDSVAKNKNLKRVYVRGADKHGAKNFTNAVIAELNLTLSQRLAGFLEEPQPQESPQSEKIWQKQFNFSAYPVANAPEKGIPPSCSARLAKPGTKTIVADTRPPETGISKLFAWQLSSKIQPYQKQTARAKQPKQKATAAVPCAKIIMPSAKADNIVDASVCTLDAMLEFFSARNSALKLTMAHKGQMPDNKHPVASTDHTTLVQLPHAEIPPPAAKAQDIITGCNYIVSATLDFVTARNTALSLVMATQKQPIQRENVPQKPKTVLTKIPSAQIANAPTKASRETITALVRFTADKAGELGNIAQTLYSAMRTKTTCANTDAGTLQPQVKEQTAQQPRSQQNALQQHSAVAQATQPAPQQAAVKDTDTGVAANHAAETQADHPQEKQEKAEIKKVSAESPRVKTAEVKPAAAPITIQVAACINKNGAERAASSLRAKNIPATVRQGTSKNGTIWWHLLVTAENPEQANIYRQKLTQLGYSPFIVKRKTR